MYDIALCDDNPVDRTLLRKRIMRNTERCEDMRIHEYGSGAELLKAMEIIRFLLIFLDVQMEDMDGEETAVNIRERDDGVVLVFCTGFVEPSPRSFEVQPYRYIMKNMREEKMQRYIKDALLKMTAIAEMPVLAAKCNKRRLFLKSDDIVYIEKYKKSTRVYVSELAKHQYHLLPDDGIEEDGGGVPEIRIPDKLESIYDRLKEYGFGYPHDSYIINFKYLIFCTEDKLKLEGYENKVFSITRTKHPEFTRQKQEFMLSKFKRGC